MVTAGTYQKANFFNSRKRLRYLNEVLLELAEQHGWQFEAWSVFSNHYHWIGKSPKDSSRSLSTMVRDLHRITAKYLNELDSAPGRKIWHNYWETPLTFEKSYLARLNYVIQNPVKHGLVLVANQYPWCSAAWFEKNATTAFQKTVASFQTDRLKIDDDF